MVSEYCSACVSCVGLSTKQATQPYSDNLLNRTWNSSELCSDKDIQPEELWGRLLCWLGSQLGIQRKLRLSPPGTVRETVLGHLLSRRFSIGSERSKPTTEFAQPRLSRVKARSSPARGYKFGCVCSYMAGHYPSILMTGHIGTNTPKFVPPRWGRPRFDPTQTGMCKFGCGFGARWGLASV